MEEQITVRSVYWLNVYTQRISGYQSVGFGWLSDFVSRDIEYKSGKHCLSLVSFKEDFIEITSERIIW